MVGGTFRVQSQDEDDALEHHNKMEFLIWHAQFCTRLLASDQHYHQWKEDEAQAVQTFG